METMQRVSLLAVRQKNEMVVCVCSVLPSLWLRHQLGQIRIGAKHSVEPVYEVVPATEKQ